jgi:hypothetical protein
VTLESLSLADALSRRPEPALSNAIALRSPLFDIRRPV